MSGSLRKASRNETEIKILNGKKENVEIIFGGNLSRIIYNEGENISLLCYNLYAFHGKLKLIFSKFESQIKTRR